MKFVVHVTTAHHVFIIYFYHLQFYFIMTMPSANRGDRIVITQAYPHTNTCMHIRMICYKVYVLMAMTNIKTSAVRGVGKKCGCKARPVFFFFFSFNPVVVIFGTVYTDSHTHILHTIRFHSTDTPHRDNRAVDCTQNRTYNTYILLYTHNVIVLWRVYTRRLCNVVVSCC